MVVLVCIDCEPFVRDLSVICAPLDVWVQSIIHTLVCDVCMHASRYAGMYVFMYLPRYL